MVGLAQVLFAASLLSAAACDVATRRIPDVFALGILAGFVATASAEAIGAGALAWHVLTAILVFGGGALLFFAGWMGGGDVKLLAASSLWIGWAGTPRFLVLVALFGGGLALVALLARLALRNGRAPRLRRAIDSEEGLPYGVAIATAGLLVGLPVPSISG
jgi:prepilin peptidase CpaA